MHASIAGKKKKRKTLRNLSMLIAWLHEKRQSTLHVDLQ